MPITPTLQQIHAGMHRYKRGDRPWPERTSTWYVAFDGEQPVPLKYLYALAVDVEPSSLSTNQIKAAVQSLNLPIVEREIGFESGGSDNDAAQGLARSSERLVVGKIYTRAELKALFGITDATINNGIFKPKTHQSVWLFVTKDKTADRTQYHDSLDGDVLTMQGQTKGRTDHLITHHASQGNELLLFYRESKTQHVGAGFTYVGPFQYESQHGANPTTFRLKKRVPAHQFKHGDKRTWELAVDAITALGGSATPADIQAWILGAHTGYNTKNLTSDLAMLAVNSMSRTSYAQNARPRRTDQGSEYDRLFKVGDGPGVRYELYQPAEHGVWEIFADADAGNRHGMSVRQAVSPITEGVEQAAEDAEQQGVFDADGVEDARKRVWSAIVRRRGQATFRKALLDAYQSTCAITGCALPDVLEAAHVHPYRGAETNVVSNGLLLRTDVHTLFDLGLLAVDSESMTIEVSPQLKNTDYGRLHGARLRQPQQVAKQVSKSALDWHRSRCGW